MLKVSHISKYYDDIKAVDDLSFEVSEKEIFGLLGVNGAGKTTTFRMIVGLLDQDKGTITLNNKPIDYDVTDKIGFLTEEKSLLVKLTVKEQIHYYATLKGMDKNTIDKQLDYWLERLHISEFKNKRLKELSKGNQQKIQFITAIINNPKLLILDEPFTSLDPFNVSLLVEILKELSSKGTIVIFSSHRMEHVEMFCDRLLILVEGKTILSGSLKEIKENYRKKNIHINANVQVKDLKNIKGVENVSKTKEDIVVQISDSSYIDNVFNVIKKCDNVTKFVVEDPTLNEIFVSIVGDVYDK